MLTEEQTNQLDCARRNLHTHFREGDELNIVKRYEAYKELNQVSELKRSIDFLHLCKKIEDYTMSVMSRIERKQQQESKEWNDSYHTKFNDMKDRIINSKTPQDTKIKIITMLERMEKKLTDLFDLK
ncbi:MAG: hypothetical protein PHE70_10295 [Tepidanaerobacteraceae bacterium]|nr:hypothetical protein [Tepidanaerobacteraceae bacterium]OFX54567.1 MAG: hypothetical protein A2W87_05450 [Bacteroidetes bacterium GWC2_46_850]HBB00442.1 hypothetical protein [Porphyromonadaceae bacterium]